MFRTGLRIKIPMLVIFVLMKPQLTLNEHPGNFWYLSDAVFCHIEGPNYADNKSSKNEFLKNRARDMVIEQRGHFWGVQGHSSLWGLVGEVPGKIF